MATKPLNPIQITRDYVKNLKDKIRVEKTILFGSSARDEMNQDSDLDIIIISPDFKKMKYIDRLILLSKARGNQFTFIPMDILGYTNEEFEKMAKESVVLGEAQKEGKEISFK
ncbi:MAG: polymerase beta domain protein region protein [Parcubacteria group bacterium GW2011_GWA1_36_12]|nr:MAG: polymerase beta domain protein region protein [Parcubacteria group bacterium GW2011_GWA1_36_12]